MSNPSALTLQLPAAVANGIALSQSLVAAGTLVLAGSLASAGVANLVTPQRVVIVSAGNDAGLIWTIIGTNASGAPISETLAGATAVAVNSALDYLSVTSISGSGATASTVIAGTNTIGSSPWVLDNFLAPGWYLSVAVALLSGSGTYTVEHTYDDPNQQPAALQQYGMSVGSSYPAVVFPNATLVNIAATLTNNRLGEANYANQPIMAHRLTVNSGTGLFKLWSLQAGIGDP